MTKIQIVALSMNCKKCDDKFKGDYVSQKKTMQLWLVIVLLPAWMEPGYSKLCHFHSSNE